MSKIVIVMIESGISTTISKASCAGQPGACYIDEPAPSARRCMRQVGPGGDHGVVLTRPRWRPRSGSVSDGCWRAPIPGQKLVDALGRMIWQPGEDVGEAGLPIDIVELRGRDERVDSGRPAATFVRAGECPVAAPQRHGTQLAFGGVVGHA